MCLMIHRPDGADIPLEILEQALIDNPDGWGITTIGRAVKSSRGLSPNSFWKAYARARGEAFIHFRFATHGNVTIGNCHPFAILDSNYVVMHNGTIDTPIVDKTRSDTWHYCNRVLAPMLEKDPEAFGSDDLDVVISSQIGTSKLAIIRHDGQSMIVNRDLGTDLNGAWYSNHYSFPRKPEWIDDWDLETLADCDVEEIAELCETDPYGVACLIRDHFRKPRHDDYTLDFNGLVEL